MKNSWCFSGPLYSVALLLAILWLALKNPTVQGQKGVTGYFGGSDHGAYLHWVLKRGARYENVAYMPRSISDTENEGTAIHWSIVDSDDSSTMSTSTSRTMLHIAVAARARGWVGFGFASENGGMRGADVIMFSIDNPNALIDGYVLDELRPIVDACQSWTLTHSQTYGGFLIFEGNRALDTGDEQHDRKILVEIGGNGSGQKVIAAWGDDGGETNAMTIAWPYHGNKRVMDSISFGGGGDQWERFRERMKREADGSFFLRSDDHFISSNLDDGGASDASHFCFNASTVRSMGVPLDNSLHMIGFEPVVNGVNVDNSVHQLVAVGYALESNACPGTWKYHHGDTDNEAIIPALDIGHGINLFSWASGSGPRMYPKDVGLPLGDGGVRSFSLRIVYHSTRLQRGHTDRKGVIVYWTSKLHIHQTSDIGLGDVGAALRNAEVGHGHHDHGDESRRRGYSKHEFRCPSSCTKTMLAVPITVYAETFHTHNNGVVIRATNEVIRDGEVVHTTANDFYDHGQHQQRKQPAGMDVVVVQQKSFQVLPGDEIVSTCYYNDTSRGGHDHQFHEVFSYASTMDEICLVSMSYYIDNSSNHDNNTEEVLSMNEPMGGFVCGYGVRTSQRGCSSSYNAMMFDDVNELERTFGGQMPTAALSRGDTGQGDTRRSPQICPHENDVFIGDAKTTDRKKTSELFRFVIITLVIILLAVSFDYFFAVTSWGILWLLRRRCHQHLR